MNNKFNLKSFMKMAFYDDGRGYMTTQSRAWSNCYKCKSDNGMQPQEAWEKCRTEYQDCTSSADWALKYVSTAEGGPRPYLDAKTPSAQAILDKK